MQDQPVSSHNDDEALYLVGFCLNIADKPDVYTLITSGGENDRPITVNKRVIFFKRPELAPAALELASKDLKRLGPTPKEVELICDVQEMLRLVDTEEIDETATILNCLNTFFDLIYAVNQPIPEEYKQVLYAMADHLTFHREFGMFLEEQQIERADLREAIVWLIKTVFAHSNLLSLQNRIRATAWLRTPKKAKRKTKRVSMPAE